MATSLSTSNESLSEFALVPSAGLLSISITFGDLEHRNTAEEMPVE